MVSEDLSSLAPARGRARRDVGMFLAVVVVVVAVLSTVLIRSGRPVDDQPLLVVLLTCTPALVSIVLRMAGRQGFGDVSFRLNLRKAWRWYLIVWLIPIAVGALAYGIGWSTGLAPMRDDSGAGRVLVLVAVNATVAVPLNAVLATGEEIGWRGYLLPRMVQAGIRGPVVATSIVWWLFHVPLILAGLYASGPSAPFAALVFGGSVLALGAVAGWSRLDTGSVWPAVLLHATWNAVIQGAFDVATAGEGPRAAHDVWVGESGLFVAGAALLVTAVVWWWRAPARTAQC
ncbi:type II CAAX prenyl endopeptidase Rce1 family protein [Cryptosporangium sp. NPDC048952]|uniref:CPBP family glutamic-type intramembrane protease n=1 Tax=Cryptosporangium sp. NPDC048952 TaxID=3363961 RepID=UPI00371E73EE